MAAVAQHVHIDSTGLATYAAALAQDAQQTPGGEEQPPDDPAQGASAPHHDTDEDRAAFVMALDAVNFGSGYFPYIRKRPGMSGYHTIANSLAEYVSGTGPITGVRLRRITAMDCSQIFGQELDGGLQGELMELFAAALNQLGTHLEQHHDDSFTSFIAHSEGSAERLVDELRGVGFFNDVCGYRELEVPLLKRAQIVAWDLALTFGHRGLGHFDDLHRLTIFADNLVPHVLRVDGVLTFSPELVERINNVDDITANTQPEIEIRAVAVHAVEQLRAALAGHGVQRTSAELDLLLWTRGGEGRYKAIKRHRTRTTAY